MPAAESKRGWSPMTIRPAAGLVSPAMQRRVSVFPAPEGPKRAVMPAEVVKWTARRKAPTVTEKSTSSFTSGCRVRRG
jgi:hypothetical protein